MIKIICFLFSLLLLSCQSKPVFKKYNTEFNNQCIKELSHRGIAGQKKLYKFFNSWNEAKNHFQDNVPGMTVYSPSIFKAGYKKIDRLSQPIMNAYQLLYPERMKYVEKKIPWFLIVEQSKVNAAIYSSSSTEQNMYYLVLTIESLTLNENALSALLAHEFAHLFLQTTAKDPMRNFPVKRYYDVNEIKLPEAINEKIPVNRIYSKNFVKDKNSLRLYTKEDHADEVMQIILKELGIPIADLFVALSTTNLKNKQFSCLSLPGEEPQIKLTKDEYNPCWRWWRLNQLK